jgi:hypothetical protein
MDWLFGAAAPAVYYSPMTGMATSMSRSDQGFEIDKQQFKFG